MVLYEKKKLFENNDLSYNLLDYQIVTKIHTNGIWNFGDREMDG